MLLREGDGRLFDIDDRRVVTVEELLDDLKAGRRFRAHRRSTGADCTVEVLVEALGPALSGHSAEGSFAGLPALLGVRTQRPVEHRSAPDRSDHV